MKSGDRASVSALLLNNTKASMPPIFTSAVSVQRMSALLSAGYLPTSCESLSLASRMGGLRFTSLLGSLDPLPSVIHEVDSLTLDLSLTDANFNTRASSVSVTNESMLKLACSS